MQKISTLSTKQEFQATILFFIHPDYINQNPRKTQMAQHKKTDRIMLVTMIVAITMTVLYGGAMAQSSGCTGVLISMSSCLNYISGNSSTPSSGCCSALTSVVQSQPQCLCQVLNGGGSSLGVNINQTQALELPKACNVQTPPTSRCNAASPGNSPTTPSGNPSSKGSETNTVPSTNNGSSDAASMRFTTIPIISSLLIAAYAMLF